MCSQSWMTMLNLGGPGFPTCITSLNTATTEYQTLLAGRLVGPVVGVTITPQGFLAALTRRNGNQSRWWPTATVREIRETGP